jgi:hypothetical protein
MKPRQPIRNRGKGANSEEIRRNMSEKALSAMTKTLLALCKQGFFDPEINVLKNKEYIKR